MFLGAERGRYVNLTTFRYLRADWLDNVGSLTSHNPKGLQWPVTVIAFM
jgi:hypothetical protein